MTVYDSQGNDHTLDIYYVKTADNEWTVHAMDSTTGTSAGDFTMSFNSDGSLVGINGTADTSINLTINGSNGAAAAQPITLSMLGSLQQNTVTTSFGNPTQDGYAPGDPTRYAINDDGTITGTYSNQQTQLLGQIVLASFSNPEGLQSEGDNVWSATSSSGQAAVGIAGIGTYGSLTADR
nr:Flagellar hook protein FlgE [Candidatus Pantoea persica]